MRGRPRGSGHPHSARNWSAGSSLLTLRDCSRLCAAASCIRGAILDFASRAPCRPARSCDADLKRHFRRNRGDAEEAAHGIAYANRHAAGALLCSRRSGSRADTCAFEDSIRSSSPMVLGLPVQLMRLFGGPLFLIDGELFDPAYPICPPDGQPANSRADDSPGRFFLRLKAMRKLKNSSLPGQTIALSTHEFHPRLEPLSPPFRRGVLSARTLSTRIPELAGRAAVGLLQLYRVGPRSLVSFGHYVAVNVFL